MQQLWADFLYEVNEGMIHQAREWTLNALSLLTGAERFWAIVIFWIIIAELLLFLLFFPLHRKILKKLTSTKQSLVQQIDEIIYLLAKTQYDSPISERELGGDPHMAMMKEMFKSGHFEYLDNISVIKANVEKVELLLRKQVATPEQWELVTKFQKKMKRLTFRNNFIGGFITVGTVGIYKIFR